MNACSTPGCRWPAAYGEQCLNHAARARVPAALAEQRRRAARSAAKPEPFDFGRYHDDPVAFARDALGIEPWSRQADFLRAVAENDRVAVKAGQKVSKSCTLAILSLWFAGTRPGSRTLGTNSSARQVQSVNYRELKIVIKRARLPLGIKTVHDSPSRGVVFENSSEIVMFTTDEADRWGGISGDDMLFFVDEGSGVPTAIFEAIEGNTAGDNAKLVVCGNPLRPADYFFDCFNSKSSSWHTMTISSLESPNVVEGREVVRGLASAGYIKRIESDYGVGSPFWCARVLGEFPSQSEYNVIALADVLAAAQRYASAVADVKQRLRAGLDVARFGDDESVLAFVRGDVVVAIFTYRGLDGHELAQRVVEAATKLRIGEEIVEVAVDVIGIGSSPFDALRRVPQKWVKPIAITVSESPTVDDHYSRLRDQIWFDLARWLKTGAIPNDPKLIGELTAPTYSFDIRGNRKVEGKDSLKSRLGRSPDRADALGLAIHKARGANILDSFDRYATRKSRAVDAIAFGGGAGNLFSSGIDSRGARAQRDHLARMEAAKARADEREAAQRQKEHDGKD